MTRLAAAFLLFATTALAQENRANLTITTEARGDVEAGVVVRATFRFTQPSDIGPETPLELQGSWSQNGVVVKRFRYPLVPPVPTSATSSATLAAGDAELDVRLMVPLKEDAPVILAHVTKKVAVAKTNKPFVATDAGGAEEIIAEGVVPETSGAVKIRPPRRDVGGESLRRRSRHEAAGESASSFSSKERSSSRATRRPTARSSTSASCRSASKCARSAMTAAGRYVDADAFIVNERETPLEVKITRTTTPDGVSHFKLSVQNPKNAALKSVALFAGQKKIREWSGPPYAIDIPNAKLAGVEFVRASVLDETNYEASDLLFLSGDRYMEEIEVNLVELPVTVSDSTGAPMSELKQANFTILENGKPQTIRSFAFAANLPLSVGLLVDHSGSMEKRMEATKAAASEFFKDIMKPGDRAFVGGFSFDANQLAPFVSDVASLRAQVDAVPDAGGGTSLYDAIVTGLYRFRSVQGRKALIILTDGEDTTSRVAYDDMLTYVRASRVPLYFIGIGLGIGDAGGTSKMRTLAAETGGVAYFIRNVKELGETYRKLESDLRSQYLIAYNTESSKKDTKYRTVEVKVNRPDAKVRTIRGFIP